MPLSVLQQCDLPITPIKVSALWTFRDIWVFIFVILTLWMSGDVRPHPHTHIYTCYESRDHDSKNTSRHWLTTTLAVRGPAPSTSSTCPTPSSFRISAPVSSSKRFTCGQQVQLTVMRQTGRQTDRQTDGSGCVHCLAILRPGQALCVRVCQRCSPWHTARTCSQHVTLPTASLHAHTHTHTHTHIHLRNFTHGPFSVQIISRICADMLYSVPSKSDIEFGKYTASCCSYRPPQCHRYYKIDISPPTHTHGKVAYIWPTFTPISPQTLFRTLDLLPSSALTCVT